MPDVQGLASPVGTLAWHGAFCVLECKIYSHVPVFFACPHRGSRKPEVVAISILTGDCRFFIVIQKRSLHVHTCSSQSLIQLKVEVVTAVLRGIKKQKCGSFCVYMGF